MMDTILNLGLNDETVAGAREGDRERALRLGLLPPLHPDVRRRRPRRPEEPGRGPRAVRDRDPGLQAREVPRATSKTRSSPPRTCRNSSSASRPSSRSAPARTSRRPVGAAPRRRRRRVRLVDERPRDRLPPQVQHPHGVGHRRQRAGHGLRQHRRPVRLRRRLHPRSRHRRKGVLRRIPDQRPGRGRRRRRAHARSPWPSSRTRCPPPTRSSSASARPSRTHFKDVQDFEFTIQDGKLYMLQTRNGKRTAVAALKFAIEMVKEKLIDWQTAIMRNARRPARPAAGARLRPRRAQEGRR